MRRTAASHSNLWLCTSIIMMTLSKATWAQGFWGAMVIFWLYAEWREGRDA